MADIPLMDFDQFQMHTEQIKAFLNKKGWYYKGGGSNYLRLPVQKRRAFGCCSKHQQYFYCDR